MYELNLYQSAFAIGGCIFVLFILAYFVIVFTSRCYAWLDDSEVANNNIMIKKLAALWGFKCDGDKWGCYTKEGWNRGDGAMTFFGSAAIASFVPLAVVITLDYLYVALTIAGFVAAAHLARFCFRHKKLFNEHIASKDAHQDQDTKTAST